MFSNRAVSVASAVSCWPPRARRAARSVAPPAMRATNGSVESAPGRGAEFRVRLPLLVTAADLQVTPGDAKAKGRLRGLRRMA